MSSNDKMALMISSFLENKDGDGFGDIPTAAQGGLHKIAEGFGAQQSGVGG